MFAGPKLIFIPRLSAFDKSQQDAVFYNGVVNLQDLKGGELP